MTGRTTLALVVGTIMGIAAATLAVRRARAAGRFSRQCRDDARTEARTVDLAGEMSFPASDPPSWTGVHASG